MTDEQNKEVKAQVQFKMEQFRDWLENSSNWDKQNAFNPTLSVQKIKELWESSCLKKLILDAFNKEMSMSVPYDDLHVRGRTALKNDVIDQIIQRWEHKHMGGLRSSSEGQRIIRFIVSQIERMM